MTKLLEVYNLRTEFAAPSGSVRVVDGIDLYLNSGETLGIVGESGSGKSITSLSIMRLLPEQAVITGGDIRLQGQNLAQLPESEMRKVRGNRIAMIFQEPMTALNPVFKIGRQLEEAIRQHSNKDKRTARKEAVSLLRDVEISAPEQVAKLYPHQLSGGMRQRVMIAMAMASSPEILIADEPTTALDVTIQAQILDLMRRLKRERGMAIMLITHDLGVVAEMCDRVSVMYGGQIVEEGDVASLFREPKHPYTVGLLKSVPQFTDGEKRLYSIAGQVPHPSEYPKGCRFAERCPSKIDICEIEEPGTFDFGNGHRCKCHLYRRDTHAPDA
ncbi:ABC transporter ATP-binding protein [Paenibacillus validus]|uniref:ATP-binding cassette domain-containing protein n=1 Tax=Paenibacillus validus TaxID=44253 RepID=A0A7X2Z9Q0_9BACL|nr:MULTISPECIES: ABC transporter ATP-binding protein [Paenibacillus]MED4599958.1 ABC transporter ATP-binding protein [Paenibacillus validus]MED4605870.1 ABC transporter ATP-binding protein [Paenibacillus validus]MUG70948.1 ATP-binding cassette domain-containing protein [Paenibacillus validus]